MQAPVLLVILAVVFACLVNAQQPAPSPVPPAPAPAPAPTPAPTPAHNNCTSMTSKPSVVTQNYHFNNASHVCIVAQFAAYIKVAENNFVELKNGRVNPYLSHCENTTSQMIGPKLVIDFDCGQLMMQISNDKGAIFVNNMGGSYNLSTAMFPFTNTSKLFVTAETGHYYKCLSNQLIELQPGINGPVNQTYELVLSNFAYEAYRTTANTDFYKIVEECALDSGRFSDGVRIGVGVCLVAFVAIMLIAYFVGRRRWSQRSSYESV